MFKRGLIVILYFFMLAILCVQSEELILSYYVLFPLILFPIMLMFEEDYRFFLPYGIALSLIVFLIYMMRFPDAEMILLGLGGIFLTMGYFFYRRVWTLKLQYANQSAQTANKNLEGLEQKHKSRLDSLHHLEKQVAGLLDLFEIARDFNHCLSFESMASILNQRVMPELPFEQLYLVIPQQQKREKKDLARIFIVRKSGIEEKSSIADLSEAEKRVIGEVEKSKKMLRDRDRLVFPLISEDVVTAYLLVDGTLEEDLAKFEVLSAYLALQVRKVRLYETVKDLSIRDGLTGVFVRRHFLERFEDELKRSRKFKLPLAVLMLDIDHFKRYNDQFGHPAGDATLKQVAQLLRQNLRKVDVVARYGGEEFIIVIPETRQDLALEVAERIRSNIARHSFKVYQSRTRVTVSVGISIYPDDLVEKESDDAKSLSKQLIAHADKALYRAKEEGRNRVVLFREI